MRFIYVYLVGYFILIVGALFVMWRADVLSHISRIWLGVGLLVVLGLGIMVAVTAVRPSITRS